MTVSVLPPYLKLATDYLKEGSALSMCIWIRKKRTNSHDSKLLNRLTPKITAYYELNYPRR